MSYTVLYKMHIVEKRFLSYAAAASVYGFGRKVYQLWDAKLYEQNYDLHKGKYIEKVKPILFADKVALCAVGTVLSPFYFPVYIYNDIRWLEVKMKGLDSDDYDFSNKPSSMLHYFF